MSVKTTQLGLSVERLPARVRYPKAKAGICSLCSTFSTSLKAEKLRKKRVKGVVSPKPPTRYLCPNCTDVHDRSYLLLPRGNNVVSPSTVVMLRQGCPGMYYLNRERPSQPVSREHALGIAYHRARQILFGTTLSSEASFLWAHPHASVRKLCEAFDDPDVFPGGIDFHEDWEKQVLRDALRSMLIYLHKKGEPLSAAQLRLSYEKQGFELLWAAAEYWAPTVDLPWLIGAPEFTDVPQIKLRVIPDQLVLLRQNGRYQLVIVDHKIPGVDLHLTLNGRDYKTQTAVYALWGLKVFASLGLKPGEITIEIHRFDVSRLGVEKITLHFNEMVRIKIAELLINSARQMVDYSRSGFPYRPGEYCQACDFAFSCRLSVARQGSWSLSIAHRPVGYKTKNDPSPQLVQGVLL